ncbi:MAG TPA: protein kinase [Polyangiaceae bacterium]
MLSASVRGRSYYLEGLLDLARLSDRAARRSSWRQSIVSLGQATSQHGPAPLEGLDPAALVPTVRVALTDGLIDDLNWLSAEAAAVALYEIASALPPGVEKREVGRRVAAYTYEGEADTFAAVATRMALGSGKGLAGPPMRARVALALELPSGPSTRIDAMALALASRRDLMKDWIDRPSRGSLAARRLAGRLIERAAGEAARLAAQGDDHATRVFRGASLAKAYQELLWDREPLVWKHAAIARGLLSGAMPELAVEIENHLSPELSPTQWRRAATSLGASVAADPMRASRRMLELFASKILQRDYGVAGCMVWGLAHGARLEPEAAEDLLSAIIVREGSSLAEAFEEGARDEPGWLKTRACRLVRRDLVLHLLLCGGRADDGWASLAVEIGHDLDPSLQSERVVRHAVNEALLAFGSQGARKANELAQDALAIARERLALLESSPASSSSHSRREIFATLRDLDISLLESAILPNLLALERRTADQGLSVPAVEELHDRLCRLLIGWEASPLSDGARPAHATVPLRRLRALIHLLDVDAEQANESSGRATTVRERWLGATHTVLRRLAGDPPSVFRRSLAAALARALEGLVRAEVCDAVDVLLFVAQRLTETEHFTILAEASKHPDLVALLRHYETFLRSEAEVAKERETPAPRSGEEPPISMMPPSSAGGEVKDALYRRIESLARLARDLSGENSSREEALRAVLVRLARVLQAMWRASSLAELSSSSAAVDSPLTSLEEVLTALAQLVTAARLRLAEHEAADTRAPLPPRLDLAGVTRAVDRALTGEASDIVRPLAEAVEGVRAALPRPVADLIAAVLQRVSVLPRASQKAPRAAPQENLLPPWMPTRRTLGGFYVLRSLGKGGGGSVFVAKRLEERQDPQAELFALKVPEYDAQAARHMSEAAFLQMFQSEATALLSLPTHPNLARFVTFDLGARPKPILVMELIDGVTLEMLISRRQLTAERALRLLDGVLLGLEAMHQVGVAHLDVKPTNVVLRKDTEPVLVDFGLAGRHIRPGCGSGPYGAPEVWGYVAEDGPAAATCADVYAAACLTYETFTTQPLFDQETETALVTAHMSHDGWPTPLRSWYRQKEVSAVAQLVGQGLRRGPKERIDIATFRKRLNALAPSLSTLPWPLLP